MDVLTAQIIALVIIVAVSFVVGGIPIMLGHKFGLTTDLGGDSIEKFLA